jgi:hypothetical protein
MLAGCGADPCERLCDRMGNRLGTCLESWPATWEDLDATSKLEFQLACRQDWDQVRADLEPRQLDDALEQCELALDELAAMRQDGSVCDQLRAIYLD